MQGEGGGRPTKYETRYNTQVYKLALLGATDKEMADFFEVAESTFYLWKTEYPKFSEAIKKGKRVANTKVAESLFKRANGYSHPDVDIKVIENKIVTTKLIKRYPPDTTAAIFWLKNREPELWRDKQELQHNSPVPVVWQEEKTYETKQQDG